MSDEPNEVFSQCKRCGIALIHGTPSLLRFCFPCVRAILGAWESFKRLGPVNGGATAMIEIDDAQVDGFRFQDPK